MDYSLLFKFSDRTKFNKAVDIFKEKPERLKKYVIDEVKMTIEAKNPSDASHLETFLGLNAIIENRDYEIIGDREYSIYSRPLFYASDDTVAKMILSPEGFSQYVKDLNLEPIENVAKRFETVRSGDDAIKYLNSGQLDKDVSRLEFETGKVKNKNVPGRYIVDKDPIFIRRMYGPKNVKDFYDKHLKSTVKVAGLSEFNINMSAINKVSSGVKMNISKCIRAIAKKLADYKDPGRVTTKDHPTLAKLMTDTKGTIDKFLTKVEEWAKPETNDTYKDKMIKQIYSAFIKHMKHHETDTPADIMKINKEADEIVTELIKAADVSQQLIDKIDRYKRRTD